MGNAGNLDQRVTFQSATLVSDGMGGSTKTWADIATTPTVWAQVKPQSGREVLDADRTNAVAGYSFTIRLRSDITEAMQIVWGGVEYNIRNVMRASGRELFMEIMTERGVQT